VKGTINDPFPFSPWYLTLPALIQSLLLGPVGEEFGWRGLALPLLQRRFAPFWASLILGIIGDLVCHSSFDWALGLCLMDVNEQSKPAFGSISQGA